MSQIKFSKIVAEFLKGDNIVTERDSQGLYVKWDSIELNLKTGVIAFRLKGVDMFHMEDRSLTQGDKITFLGFEGKCRINMEL